MKIRSLANGIITAVNPNITAKIYKATGGDYVDGVWTPTYETQDVIIQRQQNVQKEIEFVHQLGFQGVFVTVYLDGFYDGINRITEKSADIFQFEGNEFQVVHVPENWPDWSRVILWQQKKSLLD